MLHLFKIQEDRLDFDTESQSLHLLDETSWQVLSRYQENNGKRPSQAVLRQLQEHFGPDTITCAEEVDQLITTGVLFMPAEQVPKSALYPDGPKIKSMCLHLYHDCNMRCQYCFAGTGDYGSGRRSMLNLETGRKAVDFLIEASGDRHNLDIDFFGGEPLLNWPVVVELTEYCEKRGRETGKSIRLTITTNALKLDREKTDFINKHFKNCVLSIDGRPSVHDRMRPDAAKRGTYDRVAKNIRSFVELRGDLEYYLRGTYTRYNLDFDQDVMQLAQLGRNVSIEPVVAPDGVGYEIRPEDIPTLERSYERLAVMLFDAWTKGKPVNFFHFNIDLEGGPCLYKRLKGCGVGTEYCAVTPDGDIYPCHQFVGIESFKMGNVNDDPVELNPSVQGLFSDLLVPEKPDCLSCWARYFCSGGCAANAWFASGSLQGTYETGCRLEQKRLECALWLQAKKIQFEMNRAE